LGRGIAGQHAAFAEQNVLQSVVGWGGRTMVKTVVQWAIAVLSVTTSAPIWASGSAFDAVRFPHRDFRVRP